MFLNDYIDPVFENCTEREFRRTLGLLNFSHNGYVKFMNENQINDIHSFISGYKKDALLLLAKAYNIELKKYDRKKLIEKLVIAYKENRFNVLFNLLSKSDINILNKIIKLCDKQNISDEIIFEINMFVKNNDEKNTLTYLFDLGLCSTYINTEKRTFTYHIPKKILLSYKKNKFNLNEGQEVSKYLGQIILMVGIHKKHTIYEMLNKCLNKKISYETFLIYLFGYIRTEWDCYIYNDYLVHDSVDIDRIDEYIEIQEKSYVYDMEIINKEIIDIYNKKALNISIHIGEVIKILNLHTNIEFAHKLCTHMRFDIDVNVNSVLDIIQEYIDSDIDLRKYVDSIKLSIMDTRRAIYGGYKKREIDDMLSHISIIKK